MYSSELNVDKKLDIIHEKLGILLGNTSYMTQEEVSEKLEKFFDAINDDNKIEATIIYRNLTGKRLKESKDFVFDICDRLYPKMTRDNIHG